MLKDVLAVLLRLPATSVVAPVVCADVSTGKFWRLLEPLSPSPASFGVTPLPPPKALRRRSIPSVKEVEPLERMLLPRIALPVPLEMETPSPLLNAIVFPSPADTPPIELLFGETERSIPGPLLPRPTVPVTFVQMSLP